MQLPPEDQSLYSQEDDDQRPLVGGAIVLFPPGCLCLSLLNIRDRIELWNRMTKGEFTDLQMPIGFPALETISFEGKDLMDLQSYYQHARLLQHQAEEAERMEAEKQNEAIKSAWRLVAAKLRELLPVEGMKFLSTFEGQFNEAPSHHIGFDIDCIIRPDCLSIPLGEFSIHRSEIEDRKGIIRATVYWNEEANPPSWDVHSWTVRVKDKDERYDAPYVAFIMAFEELKGETEEEI